MPKETGPDAGQLYPGEPADLARQALWQEALEGLDGGDLAPLARLLRTGQPVVGILSEELAAKIESGVISFSPAPLQARQDDRARLWAEVGAWCMVRLADKPRGWSADVYFKAAERFSDRGIGSARNVRRACTAFSQKGGEALGLDIFTLISIWGAAQTSYTAEIDEEISPL